jgi:hypothetical protein
MGSNYVDSNPSSRALCRLSSRISVVSINGATIQIDDASVTDTILSVKFRVFAANHNLLVGRQRLMYRPGPHGINALSNNETLGDAGVAQDGLAVLDVLLLTLKPVDTTKLAEKV